MPFALVIPSKMVPMVRPEGRALNAAPHRISVLPSCVGLAGESPAAVSAGESERQALALMDHPNIARVYDAGATEQGDLPLRRDRRPLSSGPARSAGTSAP